MLRHPPFNVQADRAGDKERRLATPPALLLERVLRISHEGKQGLLLRLPANHWSLRGSDWGTEGLVRWRLAGLLRPELDHSGLSMLQERTRAHAPCQSERLFK